MVAFEFDQEMARIYEVFKRTQYTAERTELIFKGLCNLPRESFRRIVTHFISTYKTAPLPKDFFEAAIRERNHIGFKKESKPREIWCKKCNDSGVVNVLHKASKKRLFMHCDGIQENGTTCDDRNPWNLPRWAPSLDTDFTFIPFFGEEALKWKPKKFSPARLEESLKDKVEEWKLMVRVSEQFWIEYAKS